MSAAAPPDSAPRPHFALFGFPVRISPFFLLVAVMFGLPQQTNEWTTRVFGELAIWVGIVFVSVLWHELGHAFLMKRYGFSPAIALHGLGGHTTWGPGPATTPGQRILVSAAGPGFGILLGIVTGIIWLLLPHDLHWSITETVKHLAVINLFWSVLNLVPMVPWDGGHILEGILDLVTKGRGRKPAAVVSIALAVGLGAWMISLTEVWMAMLCGISVLHAVQIFRAESARLPAGEELRRARMMLEQVGSPAVLVSAAFRGADAKDRWMALAGHLERNTIAQLERDDERAAARELASWAYLLAGATPSASRVVTAMRATHEPSPLLAGVLAARTGDPRAALAVMEAMGEGDSPGARELVVAYASASLGEVDAALDALGSGDAARKKGAWIDTSLFYAEQFDAAAQLAEALFERFRNVEDAYNAACSQARAGRAQDGLRMLEAAIDAGYRNLEQLEGDKDMVLVRALDGYGALRSRLVEQRVESAVEP